MLKIIKINFVFTILVMTLIISACSKEDCDCFSGGKGTERNPYLIGSAKELNEIRNFIDKHFLQIADIDLTEYSSDKGWLPISDFEGTYDGNNLKITNLTINRIDEERVGLFGNIHNGKVTNVSLVNVDINGLNIVGALSGSLYANSTVENCNATGVVNSSNGFAIGGLIGSNWRSTISNCYADVSIHNARSEVGGLVGDNNFEALVERSYALGAIVDAEDTAGGLIGLNWAFIEDCYATGSVSGIYNIGGLVGISVGQKDAPSSIINSYTMGNVFASPGHAGGLIGYSSGTTIYSSYWDKETAGQEISSGSDYGFGMTSLQMKTKSTYSGWDFDQIWDIVDGETYPFLR